MTDGQLATSQSAINQALGRAKGLKLTNRPLSDSEKQQAGFLQDLGVPNKIARHFAAQPLNNKGQQLAKKLRSQSYSPKRYSKSSRKRNGANVLYFGGRGLKNRSRNTAQRRSRAVSYTHLTLPTKRIV